MLCIFYGLYEADLVDTQRGRVTLNKREASSLDDASFRLRQLYSPYAYETRHAVAK